MKQRAIDLEQVAADCREFAQQFQTVQLATASTAGVPEASYAPFYREGRDFYVFLSELSRHARNLLENPRASLLLIENEGDAANLFSRRRLVYQCTCQEVERGGERFEQKMDAFQAKFGNMIGLLRELGDFHLYRITPVTGTYVAGFAKAYELVGEDLGEVRHIG